MFEDFEQKKIEEDDDSESWSYSYPSYSRFTITGKTKSRLGRSSRQNRQQANKNEMKIKEDHINSISSEIGSTSSQVPNTPGHSANWLRGDTFQASFTPSTQPRTGHDQQCSVNDSGVDVSMQSNFFYSLKNDSVKNSNCKRNLTFTNTQFITEEPKKGSAPEQNQLIKLPPLSQLKFPFEENKENKPEEKVSDGLKNKEKMSFDPSWSQFKRICDGNIPFAPLSTMSSEINEPVIAGARNHYGRTASEPFNPLNIFTPLASKGNGKKENDDYFNVPLDLSSAENLTNKTFNRSITGGSDHTPVSAEMTSSTYPQTLPHQVKDNSQKVDDRVKQTYSEDINSILPAFLVPTNKNRPTQNSCLNDNRLKTSPPNAIASHGLNSNIPNSIQTSATNVVLSAQNLQGSHYPGRVLSSESKTTTEGYNFNSINNSEKPNIIQFPHMPSSKTSNTILNHSADLLDSHMKNSTIETLKQPNQETSRGCNENVLFSKPVDNIFTRRESWIGHKTQNQPLSSQLSTLKLREEESKEPMTNESNKVATNVYENITLRKTHNPTHMESSVKSKDQPENLIMTNINEDNVKKETTESPLISTSNLAVDQLNSRDNGQSLLHITKITPTIEPNFETKIKATNIESALLSENSVKYAPHQQLSHPQELKHTPEVPALSKPVEAAKVMTEVRHVSNPPQISPPEVKHVASYDSLMKQSSVQVNSTASQSQGVHNTRHPVESNQPADNGQRMPEQGYQKTYLAPQAPVEQRNINNFPHVKPPVPQQNNRPSFSAPKKPQNTFKMPGQQGLLSRGNPELYVNGKMYTILSMLGRGGSSEVYQVLDPRSSKLMAVKCVDLSMVDKTIADGYLNEIDLLSKLQGCASVIRMFDYEYVEENKMLYVVMEKGDTDLSQLIRDISKTKKISMSMIIYYWTEMLNAVKDIHEQGIIHSDLKPANFLLVSGRLKLIDFGIASSQGDMTSVVKEVTTGTWNYMSPEAIRNTSSSGKGFKITYKSDVWSLGCILYNLVYGKTPFSHITNTWGKLQAIADSSHRIEFPEVGAPVVLAGALRSCFHRDPKQRPTVAELLRLQYHATCDTNHIGRQLLTILPAEWWTKVSHLFPDVRPSQEEKNPTQSTA